MFKTIQNFLHDESGATAIEYSLIAALISIAAIAALQATGTSLVALLTKVKGVLSTANGTP